MSLDRIYAGADGESPIEDIPVAQRPELGALRPGAEGCSSVAGEEGDRT
jgi:hypothetical protein